MRDPSWVLLRTHRSFRRYWLGQAAAGAGAQVTAIALPLVTAIALDAGPAAVSLVAAAGTLPYLLFSLVAGHFLQGRDQRRWMVAADLVQCVLLAQIPLAWAGGWLSVPLLAAITFASGCCALGFGLSAFAYVPSLVRDKNLAPANRAVQATRTVTEIGGPGLAGLLVSAAGAPGALVATMLGHLASAVGVATSRPWQGRNEVEVPDGTSTGTRDPEQGPDPGPGPDPAPGPGPDPGTGPDPGPDPAPGPDPDRDQMPAPGAEKHPTLLTGLRILFGDRHLRALTVHAATYNAAEQILVLNLILWAVQQQDVGVGAYGAALAAAGVGGLLGTLTALRLADRAGLGRAFAISLVLSCAVPLLLPVWPVTGWALAAVIGAVMLLRGIGEGNANIYSLTMRQQLIPSAELTRSAGAYTQIMYGSIPLGALLAGVIGETLGVRAGVLLGALGLVVSAVPMLTPAWLRLREIPVTAPEPAR